MKTKLTTFVKCARAKTLLLLVLILAGTSQAKAVTYGLKIAGIDVTSYIYEDLSVIPGVEGTVTFDPTENILYLENAIITVTGDSENALVINNSVTIIVTGENTISSVDKAVLLNGAQTVIKGSGTLNVKSSEWDCINLTTDGYLEIDGCTVNLQAHGSGINGDDRKSSTVHIRNAAKVTAQGYYGSIRYLKALTIEGGTITQPDGAAFSYTEGAVVVDDNPTTETVTIEPKSNYSIFVAGMEITSDNCNDLSVIPGVSGTANYDPAAKTLYLENATIDYQKGAIRNNYINGFTINVTGENTVSSNPTAIKSLKNFAIDGSGTLNANSVTSCGIYVDNSSLKIRNCTVNAKGDYGIAGSYGTETETLSVYEANVTAEGTKGSICDFASLTLNYCKIVQPNGAVFDESKNAVVLDGKTVTDKVVIEKFIRYGFKINEVEVTSDNCNDLSVIEGVSGTVKYDPERKTLTLEDATINATNKNMGIYNLKLMGLTIRVKGENNINTEGNTGLYLQRFTTINGDGILNIKSPTSHGISAQYYGSLEIEKCTLNIESGKYGIYGYSFYRPALNIYEANITSQGAEGAISGFSSLTLEGCSIIQPEGAAYDPQYKNVMANGEKATRVVIEYDPTSDIGNATTIKPAHKQGIYSLDGIYLGNDFGALPKGIYIKDGKKVLK